MKKILSILLILILAAGCAGVIANERTDNGFSKKFTQKFKNCDVYIENATFNMAGTVFHDRKQILGRNGKNCEYLQVTGTANGILTVSCSFNEALSRDLYNALLIKPDYRAGINKTEEIWQKAMQNPKNCTYKRSEYYSKGFQIDPEYLPAFN